MSALLRAMLIGGWLAVAGPGHAADGDRAARLAAELRCVVCQNQSIAESNADVAVELRRQIGMQIAAGRSDAQIREFMVARYGEFVLYRPPFKATTALLWIGPALLLVAGFAVLYRAIARAAPATQASDQDDASCVAARRWHDVDRGQPR